jgi:uncharacterized membrane protein YfcA
MSSSMNLEIYHMIILIGIGLIVGISISFVGQTGQGVVLPIVLLFTGDIFLAIAVNLLNDLITSFTVSIKYIRRGQFKIETDILIIIGIAIVVSIFGVFILMTTPLGKIYGWFIPLFITCLGLFFLKNGFPTTEKVKKMVKNIRMKISKRKDDKSHLKSSNNSHQSFSLSDMEEFEGYIKKGTRIYYILAIIFGVFVGLNSGLFGGSSGLIFVLALVIIYSYPLKKGVGTALVLSVVVGLSTFITYQILGLMIFNISFIDLQISLFLAIGSIISGLISSTYIQKMSAITMGRTIGIVIVILGIASLIVYFTS